jgi:hypothetical protein
VILFSCTYAVGTGNSRFVIPILSIGLGLLLNSFDVMLRINEYLWLGYWLAATGCILLVFNAVSPLLGLSVTLGCGLLLLAVLWYLPPKKRMEA